MTITDDLAAHFDHLVATYERTPFQTAFVKGKAEAFTEAAAHVRNAAAACAYTWEDADDDLQTRAGFLRARVELVEPSAALRRTVRPVYQWSVRYEQYLGPEDGLDWEDLAEGTVIGDWGPAVRACEAILDHYAAVERAREAEIDEAMAAVYAEEEALAVAAGAVNPEDLGE
jgi:hypothetical protein